MSPPQDPRKTCAECTGLLELKVIDGRERFVCFICGKTISPILLADRGRWWGNFHLPLIDIFIRPRSAFLQLTEHPCPLAALLFYFAIWSIQSIYHRNDVHNIIGLFCFLGFDLLAYSLAAVIIHGISSQVNRLFKGQASPTFGGIWSVVLFLAAWRALIEPFLGSSAMVHRLFTWAYWAILAWGISVVYQAGIALALVAMWASLSAPYVLVLGSIVAGAVSIRKYPILAQQSIPRFLQTLATRSGIRNKIDPRFVPFIANPEVLKKLAGQRVPMPTLRAPSLQRMDAPSDFRWELSDLSGVRVPFANFRGKVVFLNFWAAWCGPCREEMPSIQRLFDRFKNNPQVAILCVNVGSPRDAKNFMRWEKFTFPIFAANGNIPLSYKYDALPTSFVISKDERVVAKQVGAGSWNDPSVIGLIEDLAQRRNKQSSE